MILFVCSQGLFLPGICRPSFKTLLPARNMVFSLIRQNFVYVIASGTDQGATIPTL